MSLGKLDFSPFNFFLLFTKFSVSRSLCSLILFNSLFFKTLGDISGIIFGFCFLSLFFLVLDPAEENKLGFIEIVLLDIYYNIK